MKNKKIFRFTMYIMGFVVLALGIISNTKSGLGVTPIISIPYVFSLVFKLNFGNASMVMYVLLAVVEYIVKGKNFKLYDLYASEESSPFTINSFSKRPMISPA